MANSDARRSTIGGVCVSEALWSVNAFPLMQELAKQIHYIIDGVWYFRPTTLRRKKLRRYIPENVAAHRKIVAEFEQRHPPEDQSSG